MPEMAQTATPAQAWFTDKILMGYKPREYARSLLTPANAIAALILAIGIPVMIYRFVYGLGAATNLSQTSPWGLWISLDVVSGVALAAGGYTMATAVYIFGLEKYHPIVRPAVLTGALGYLFVVIGLLFDLGLPWHLPIPDGVVVRHAVGDVRSGLVRGALPDGALARVPPAGLRVARMGQGTHARAEADDPAHDHGRDALDPAPVVARCLVPSREGQDSPAVVLALHPALLLRVEHHRRHLDGDLREWRVAPGVPRPAAGPTSTSTSTASRWASGAAPPSCSSHTSS